MSADDDESVEVLLTGFEVFGHHKVNPSWEIAKCFNDVKFQGLKARAHLLPVDYTGVDKCYPAILVQYPNLKLIVNCGVGKLGYLKLEKRARNGPYTKKDNRGREATNNCCSKEDEQDAVRETELPLEDIVQSVVQSRPAKHPVQLATSSDAGLFLCEYTYYCSLRAKRCPSVFLHVPPFGQPYIESVLRLHVFNVIMGLVSHVRTTLPSIAPSTPSSSPTPKRPKVGLAVVLTSKAHPGCVVVGQRKTAHSDGNTTGMGTWALPGGHLEFGESFAACAQREVEEECGIRDLKNIRLLTAVNSISAETQYHYVVPFIVAETSCEPTACEPTKCEAWEWHEWNSLPQPLFAPLAELKASGIDPFA